MVLVLACACAEEEGGATSSETSSGTADSDGSTGPGPTTTTMPTTTTPMPMTMPMPTACEGDGSLGGCCDVDHPCAAALLCGPLFGDGALFGETCNNCLTDAECADGKLCAPVLEADDMAGMTAAPSGQRDCVAPMSVADDAMCPEGASGDLACMSGHCAEVDIMGVVIVYLCGACEVDTDCAEGKKCETPPFDMATGPVGPRCV